MKPEAHSSFWDDIDVNEGTAWRDLPKKYFFWADSLYAESGRPPQYHQTLRFTVRDPLIRRRGATATIRFRQVADKNPHHAGAIPLLANGQPNTFVRRGWVEYLLNGRKLEIQKMKWTRQPEGRIPSGFILAPHNLVEVRLPANQLKFGENQLAFHIPRFPQEADPYVRIFELSVSMTP